MNKLTAEKCRHHIDRLSDGGEQRCLSIYEEDYLQALEIALPVLEQQEKLLSLMPPSYCIKCDNTGQMDSGGTQPWGDAIMVTCDCQAKPSTTPQIDNDVWIEWNGGKQPIANDRELAIKFRDGTVMTETHSDCWVWSHGGDDDDIIAYRVIENDGREG